MNNNYAKSETSVNTVIFWTVVVTFAATSFISAFIGFLFVQSETADVRVNMEQRCQKSSLSCSSQNAELTDNLEKSQAEIKTLKAELLKANEGCIVEVVEAGECNALIERSGYKVIRGIGITYQKRTISSFNKGMPAEKSGLEAGDEMVEIDGVKVDDKNSDDVPELIAGGNPDSVSIKVKKSDGSESTYQVEKANLIVTK
ncbi:PDZ domain-containing protein [Candidatus Peregrinibacteria bacterium]|nr:PDZ domain-containing protein [Candidatus Peregrinibacteria bacterium]